MKFTVIINTFNQGEWIQESIMSAIRQDFPDEKYEIIVIDDGSADLTPLKVNEFKGKIFYIYKKNQGQLSAFNIGFLLGRGSYLVYLDGDDYWTTSKLSTINSFIIRHPYCILIHHAYYRKKEEDGTVEEIRDERLNETYFVNSAKDFYLYADGIQKSTSLITLKREFLNMIFPNYSSQPYIADAYMVYLAAFLGQIGYINTPLTYYRVHKSNFFFTMSAGKRKADEINAVARSIHKIIDDKIRELNLESSPLYTAFKNINKRYLVEGKLRSRNNQFLEFELLYRKLITTEKGSGLIKNFYTLFRMLLAIIGITV